MRRKVIDISSDIKKEEVYNLFLSFKNKSEAHRYFGISDNKNGSIYLREVAKSVGFDIDSYRKKKKCLNCGKEIENKWGAKFCSRSCSTSFNNKKRDASVYEKVSKKLKEKSPKKEKQVHEKIKKEIVSTNCIFCGREYISHGNSKYCSSKCATEHRHYIAYEDFLKNNKNYCRGNYTPRAFKEEFLKEQNGICAICGCKPEHNGKPLVFILDHIDGDASNNKRENLRMICPNCDSQLETYKSKNKNSTRRNYWKDKIIRDIQGNIQQILKMDNN